LETKDTGEEAIERNNRASQNSQRVVELKVEEACFILRAVCFLFIVGSDEAIIVARWAH